MRVVAFIATVAACPPAAREAPNRITRPLAEINNTSAWLAFSSAVAKPAARRRKVPAEACPVGLKRPSQLRGRARPRQRSPAQAAGAAAQRACSNPQEERHADTLAETEAGGQQPQDRQHQAPAEPVIEAI